MLALKNNHGNFDRFCSLTVDACSELNWYISHLPGVAAPINCHPITLELFVDASKLGWGCFLSPSYTNGFFGHLEKAKSINTKELLAIWYSLLSFLPCVRHSHILIRTDNTTALSYVQKMGGITHLYRDHIAR